MHPTTKMIFLYVLLFGSYLGVCVTNETETSPEPITIKSDIKMVSDSVDIDSHKYFSSNY